MPRIVTKTSKAPPQPPQDEKPFYGWRYIQRAGKNGKTSIEKHLLTLEDVLHPQEDDHIPQNRTHQADLYYLSDVCQAREARLVNGLVLSDCLIDWGVPGLGNHAADISAFDQLQVRPPPDAGTFRLLPSGGRCLLVVEIVSPASPDTRQNDVTHKLAEYHQANVPLYLIVDQKKEGGPRELLAYRNTASGYVKKTLDSQGRILIGALGIRIGLKDNRVICYDAETDKELGDYAKIVHDLAAANQALQAAEQEAREQAQARQAAEQEAREQARACQTAEQDRQTAELARQAAEREASEQAQARQAAEREAREQAQARQVAEQAQQAAEQRIRDLEVQLRSRTTN